MVDDVSPPQPPELPPGLVAEYLESARAQLSVLAGLADRIAAREDDAEALDQLRREVHKVHGSAGSYGFMGASRLAAGIEATVKDWLARPDETHGGRGALAAWFVKRLAEMLGQPVPAAVVRASLPRVGPAPRPHSPFSLRWRPGAKREDVAPPAPPAPAVVADAPVTAPEVIYVEDDAALAELLEYGLRSQGYRFLAFRNGREALSALLALDVQGTRPLLLLDVDLPALDGYSIVGALERDRPGVYRVVFTTVHGTEEEQLRGLEAGAVDYLVKPISLRVALEKIKRWVGK
jgi:CheY-like chemotaxis protein/HPt (histidine-containing phosphotransfer) domain-containing protein